jgi:para-nitrobenzyl esterase
MATIVETTLGKLQGGEEPNGTVAFRGVPYGGSTDGPRRFLPPSPAKPWAGVRECVDWGARCKQGMLPLGAMSGADRPAIDRTAAAARMSTLIGLCGGGDVGPMGDDCLNLNVWTPAVDDGRRPVMVWLHGGGFSSGSANNPMYFGDHLARRGDVVVVTVNHRLGVLGYLHLDGIGGERWAGSGNAGMLDVVLALEWVRDNITAFGGDPGRVMIFGQSGGGAKVSTVLAMPSAVGLVHRAAIQSGPGIRSTDPERADRTTRALLDALGIGAHELERLQEVPTRALADAQAAATAAGGPGMGFAPVLDGDVIPHHPFDPEAAATQRDVPVLVGCTPDEFTFFAAFNPRFGELGIDEVRPALESAWGERTDSRIALLERLRPYATPSFLLAWSQSLGFQVGTSLLAERKADGGAAPAYAYLLSWKSPVLGGILGAPHNLDLPLVFDNHDRAPFGGDDPDIDRLVAEMADAWIAFARSGDPSHPGLPEWPAYDSVQRPTMVFDRSSQVENDPESEIRTEFSTSSFFM